MPYLTPGTYSVRAELAGLQGGRAEEHLVRLGQSIDLPLDDAGRRPHRDGRSHGRRPVVDTSTTTIGAVIDSGLLERVPVGRRFSDTLYIAPGVSSSGTAGTAEPVASAGASGLDNQYVVDGVNITNGGYGALGSYSIVFGSLGNGTPYDFVQEVQVKTGGYEAEFGQATGGVVNVDHEERREQGRRAACSATRGRRRSRAPSSSSRLANGTVQHARARS